MNGWLLAASIACVPGCQEAGRSPDRGGSATSRVEALRKEYDDAYEAFSRKYQAAKDDGERQELVAAEYPRPERYAPRFLALASEAGGDPAAIDACAWVLQRSQQPADKEAAYALLLASHLESPRLGDAVRTISRYTSTIAAERFLRAAIARSPHHDVKGQANYALAGLLAGLADLHEAITGTSVTAEQRAQSERYFGSEMLDELAVRDAGEMRGEAEDLLEDVIADYGSVKGARGELAAAAAGDLFELRELQIGKVAPEIEGEDVDGAAFKLSDYRGKVVVLDFWGFW